MIFGLICYINEEEIKPKQKEARIEIEIKKKKKKVPTYWFYMAKEVNLQPSADNYQPMINFSSVGLQTSVKGNVLAVFCSEVQVSVNKLPRVESMQES